MAGISVWRANDVVTYDVMRESATMLTAVLLRSIELEPGAAESIHSEIVAWRKEVRAIDAYDRAAVASLASRIKDRSNELEGASS